MNLIGSGEFVKMIMSPLMECFGVNKYVQKENNEKQKYEWHSLSSERKSQLQRVGKIMGISETVLATHIRSVEYLLSEREKKKNFKRKQMILNS